MLLHKNLKGVLESAERSLNGKNSYIADGLIAGSNPAVLTESINLDSHMYLFLSGEYQYCRTDTHYGT